MPHDALDQDTLDDLLHDLRGPLTAVHGFSQLASREVARSASLEDGARAPVVARQLRGIEKAVARLCARLDALAADTP